MAALLLVLVAVVWCLPYLASTGAGSRWILALVAGGMPGKLAVNDLSLSWLGPCEVQGLELTDPEGRPVVQLGRVTWSAGIWRAVLSPMRFGELRIQEPQITLYADGRGDISLLRAIGAEPGAQKESEETLLPPLTGRVVVENGSLRMVQSGPSGGSSPGGRGDRQLDLSQINVECDLDALSDINGTLHFQVARGGRLEGEMKIRGLAPEGRLQPFDASGSFQVSTPADLSLAEVAAFALDQAHAGGMARLNLVGTFENGEVRMDLSTAIAGLEMKLSEQAGVEPIDLQLAGSLRATRESLTAAGTLEGEAGTGEATLTYLLAGDVPAPSFEQVLSFVLTGDPVAVPNATLEGRSRVDLVRLSQAIPALLAIRSDVQVTGGEARIERLVVRGGSEPSLGALVSLTGLTATSGGVPIQWDPMTLEVDAGLEPGRGLMIREGNFKSGFATLSASGTAAELRAELEADLNRLHQQIGQIFDTGELNLAGRMSGGLDARRVSDDRMELALDLVAEGFRYQVGASRLETERISLKNVGHLALAASGPQELVLAAGQFDIDGRITGTASGRTHLVDGSYEGAIDLAGVDLEYLASRLNTLGVEELSQVTGGGSMQVSVHRAAGSDQIVCDGALVVRDAAIDGAALSEEVTLQWSDVGFSPKGRHLVVKTVELVSDAIHVLASDVDGRFGKEFGLTGGIKGSADLARCLSIASRLGGSEEPPSIAGRLTLSGRCESSRERVQLATDWQINDLEVGAGEQPVREKQVQLKTRASFNPAEEVMEIERFQLDSQLLALRMSGTVSDYSSTRMLALRGDYSGNWEAITALIHELAPATADTLAFTGVTASSFGLTGPANQPELQPVFRELASGLEVRWDSARAYGVDLDKAVLSPALKDGRVEVPVTVVLALGGQVRLGGIVDFAPTPAIFSLQERVQVLENIQVTPEVGNALLSRINPVFGNLSRLEGAVSLMLEGIQVPLGEEIQRGGAGQGHLDLNDLKMQPGGLLAKLLELGLPGKEELYAVQATAIDFFLRDGRIHYENFALIFVDNFDLQFKGSVGFDDTVDLVVSVPVRPALLDKLGVRGPTAEYARLLADARVELPVVGTRSDPRLDLTRVDVQPLIQRAVRDTAAGRLGDLLKDPTGSRQQPQPEGQQAAPSAQPAPAPDAIGREARDLLRRLQPAPGTQPAPEGAGRP